MVGTMPIGGKVAGEEQWDSFLAIVYSGLNLLLNLLAQSVLLENIYNITYSTFRVSFATPKFDHCSGIMRI
jgi:hypothetical protein